MNWRDHAKKAAEYLEAADKAYEDVIEPADLVMVTANVGLANAHMRMAEWERLGR